MGAISTSSPALWLKADAITGLSDGAAVTSWLDSSGNAKTAAQGNAAAQPVYKSGIQNGQPVVRFAGAQFLNSAASSSGSKSLAVAINATGTSFRTLLGSSVAGGFQARINGAYTVDILAQTNAFIASSGNVAVSSGEWHVIVLTYTNASAWSFYIDGVAAGSGTTATGVAAGGTAVIGTGGGNGAEFFAGDMGELATWDRVLTGTEVAAVTAELKAKWATADAPLQGVTYTADSVFSADWLPDYLGDGAIGYTGVPTRSWSPAGSSPVHWVRMQPAAPSTVTNYRLIARTDAPAYTPSAWTFEGSNTGTSWTVLDTRSAQTFTAGQARTYAAANSTAWTYYRLNITATANGQQSTFSELSLYAAASVSPTSGGVAGTLPALTGSATGAVSQTITGAAAATLPALSGQVTGTPVTTGTSQGTLPALTGSVAGTVTGPTTGAVAGTLPSLTGSIAGTATAPVTGTVAGTLPALSGGASDAPVGQLTAHSTTRITSTITAPGDVDYLYAHSTTRISSSIVPSFELAIDPVTGRPQYRLIVVDSHGTPLGELQNAAIGDPVQKLGQAGTFTASLPSRDPKATLLDVGAQVQVWAGAQMLPGAWFVLVQPGKDGGGRISYEFVGLEGLLDNVVIGTERPELLRNGGFEEDLRFWHPTWLEGSAAPAPPKTTIVKGALAKEGGKALQVEAVESVNVREVKTAAIFYGNRPSASEPLANGFLPGGEKLITDQLDAFSKGTALLVEGFTADVDSGDGQALSQRRALAAKAVIVKARPDLKVTAAGRGETIQVAPNNSEANSAKNRRILLTGSATQVGHRQIVQQFFTWTNTSRVPVELELDGQINLIDYVGRSKDGFGLYINRRSGASLTPDALPTVEEDRELLEAYAVSYAGMRLAKAQAFDTKEELYAAIVAATPTKAKIMAAEHTDLPDDFPHERWTPDGTSQLKAPPDSRKYLYEVRLYGSAGKTIFDEISVKPNLRTGFYGATRPELFAGLVAEAQNTAHGKVDLNLEANCKPWGVRDDFEYEWKAYRTVWEAIAEQLRADDAPDFGIVVTQTRRIATTWARRGRRSPVHLRLGDIVTGYSAGVDGDKVATTAIATSNRSRGPGVAEARVRTAPVNGLVFERVQAAEPDRSRTRLAQMAAAMTRYGRTDVLTSVTCDPKWTVYLLGQVGLGDRVWCVVHDGDTHVEGWYRIVEVRHSISKHQLSYELAPEV